MQKRPLSALFLLSVLAAWPLRAEIKTEALGYEIDGQEYEGFIAFPARPETEKAPGVLVVHDWTGLHDFARQQAEKLARLGYVALAVDMYGVGQRASNPEEAKALSAPFYADRSLFRTRIAAALELLREQKQVDPKRLGAIGFCYGGTTVLELARSGADVAGVVSFHGGLAPGPEPDASAVQCRILALHGTFDPHVPPADVAAFMEEMNKAKVSYKLVAYPQAVHAFTNPEAGNDPSKGAAYNAEAANDAFSEMKRFFAELFNPPVSLPQDTAMR